MSRQILQKQSKPSHRARVSHARSVAVHHSLHHQLCSAAIDKHHTKQQIQHATRIIAHVIRVEVGAYAVTTWLTHAPRRRTDDNRCRRDQFRTRHFQLRSTHQSEHKQAHTHTHTHTHTLSLSHSLSLSLSLSLTHILSHRSLSIDTRSGGGSPSVSCRRVTHHSSQRARRIHSEISRSVRRLDGGDLLRTH
jgi:hypothetical protein